MGGPKTSDLQELPKNNRDNRKLGVSDVRAPDMRENMRRDLERRQAEMKKRQPKSASSVPVSVITRSASHHCKMRDVVFCPFCGDKIDGSGEREVTGFPKTNHRCARSAVCFCPFCGKNLIIENDKNSVVEPQPVVFRKHYDDEKYPPKTKVFRWNKMRGSS